MLKKRETLQHRTTPAFKGGEGVLHSTILATPEEMMGKGRVFNRILLESGCSIGTHTHVQTADERVLPKGTAYITDAGMCGGKNSVLGVKQEIIIKKFIDNMPARFEYDPKEIELNGVVISVDQSTGKAQSIQRVSVAD